MQSSFLIILMVDSSQRQPKEEIKMLIFMAK